MFGNMFGPPPQPVQGAQPLLTNDELMRMELAAAQGGDQARLSRIREVMSRHAQPTPVSEGVAAQQLTTGGKAGVVAEGVLQGRARLLDALLQQ